MTSLGDADKRAMNAERSAAPPDEYRVSTASLVGARASLENLVESGAVPVDTLHPGGLELTAELARLCRVRHAATVLDVAGGTGETACYLAGRLGAKVATVDVSANMVRQTRFRAERAGTASQAVQATAYHLPFRANAFDVVISECTLCLLEKEQVLREMVRVTKPDGYVGMHDLCWKAETPSKLKRQLLEIEGERPETTDGWVHLFERSGLTEVTAVDKSYLVRTWVHDTERAIPLSARLRLVTIVVGRWGVRGLRDIWMSRHIFQSPFTGYVMVVGRKPSRGEAPGTE